MENLRLISLLAHPTPDFRRLALGKIARKMHQEPEFMDFFLEAASRRMDLITSWPEEDFAKVFGGLNYRLVARLKGRGEGCEVVALFIICRTASAGGQVQTGRMVRFLRGADHVDQEELILRALAALAPWVDFSELENALITREAPECHCQLSSLFFLHYVRLYGPGHMHSFLIRGGNRQSALQVIKQVLQSPVESFDLEETLKLVQCLGHHAEGLAGLVADYLKAEHPPTAGLALDALTAMGPKAADALPALAEAYRRAGLQREDDKLRARIGGAIKKISGQEPLKYLNRIAG